MKITADLKNLVVFRLETLSKDKKVSIGSHGEFTKDELIEHVKAEDEIGRKIVQVELEWLQALKTGEFL